MLWKESLLSLLWASSTDGSFPQIAALPGRDEGPGSVVLPLENTSLPGGTERGRGGREGGPGAAGSSPQNK